MHLPPPFSSFRWRGGWYKKVVFQNLVLHVSQTAPVLQFPKLYDGKLFETPVGLPPKPAFLLRIGLILNTSGFICKPGHSLLRPHQRPSRSNFSRIAILIKALLEIDASSQAASQRDRSSAESFKLIYLISFSSSILPRLITCLAFVGSIKLFSEFGVRLGILIAYYL